MTDPAAGPVVPRHHDVSRLEGFSDAVFGFALTLLVVALEVPRNYAELQAAMSGFVAFAASFDDVVIALLVAGPEQRTLPREMFSGLRDSITPALTAVATVMIVFSTALFLLMLALQRRARRAAATR